MKTLTIISNQAFSLINFRRDLITALVDSDVRVYALAPDFDPQTRLQIEQLGAIPIDYSLSRTGLNPIEDVHHTLSLAKTLKSLRPDISFCYFIKPVIYGLIASWLAGVPKRIAMIEGLGFSFTDNGEALQLKRRLLQCCVTFLYRVSLKCAERVIFLNRDDQQEFITKSLVTMPQSFLLGGIGVDLDEWYVTPPIMNPITFTLTARLLREKGIFDYVEAARIVKSQHQNIRFILLGDVDANPGSLSRKEVEAWVEEGLIEWPGHVPVKPWLEKTSVYVLPSYREGIPRSTQEALAMGRPVITTDVPGCRETVIDGENGFIIPARNAVALAEKMRIFINNPSLIASMGKRSRELAEERFDVHQINKKFLAIFGVECQ